MEQTEQRERRSARARRVAAVPFLAAAALAVAAVPAAPAVAAAGATAYYLGYEQDQCSGRLYVKNTSNTYVRIQRDDAPHYVDVHVDGDGYWYWKCGTTVERSRGESNWRNRVERLRVVHSTDSRQIGWWCYELD
jgi:hypothetical protein